MGSTVQSEQQVAIVTGATSGIGTWLAKHIHARGYRVALCGRREKEGQDVASSIDESGESAIFIQCDVESYQSQADLFRSVWGKWGRLDVLIANAGSVDRGSMYNFARRDTAIDDLPSEPETSCTDIDLKGTIYGTTLATHFMRHNAYGKGGKIIVTGSMIGIYPCPTFPEYCAAKAATHQWVKTVGPLLQRKENITVNCVMPGGIETPAMPGFSKAFLPQQMTLKSTLLSGYDTFLDDAENRKTGQMLEAAHDKLVNWGHPGYKSGAFAKRTEAVFEPWFEMVHGERSELPGAIQDWPNRGPKIIAVTGATGSQGGGVVNVLKKTVGWKVRALTRNPESDAAKKLAAEGIEVIQASFDDEASLAKAFEGVHAVFAVTQWWEHLFHGKSQIESGEIEEEQGMKIARAAAGSRTLEHYIWSTTPSPKRMFQGKLLASHMDYKANIDARIKSELPELAAITTYLYFGYYPQNMAFFPLCKPFECPGTGQYIQTLPTKGNAKVLLSGDMSVNPGIWVRQVLATGDKAYGRYANVALEKWTFQEMVDVWSEITGKSCVFTEITMEAVTKLYGDMGNELALQFKYGEACDPWEETDDHISPEELSIDKNEVVGFRGTIEGLQQKGFWA
ncbi:NAD(P)-binding protein [Cucurbitaria berberidis CBS 394.84]|uniref:NAD(P)-binding protein n=1 Tax=Cucurbitaria berberidis CBS 394.84 TaxID=1168544 RepID=A0A9P4L831_9PLEO|nr:NAD(P)-binding protein [Cucurbitaria berberidis CBS 394.84]KAF1845600.1 NAD(P)-binding protein [Cucurbitaria berberidis CBS 394.84]